MSRSQVLFLILIGAFLVALVVGGVMIIGGSSSVKPNVVSKPTVTPTSTPIPDRVYTDTEIGYSFSYDGNLRVLRNTLPSGKESDYYDSIKITNKLEDGEIIIDMMEYDGVGTPTPPIAKGSKGVSKTSSVTLHEIKGYEVEQNGLIYAYFTYPDVLIRVTVRPDVQDKETWIKAYRKIIDSFKFIEQKKAKEASVPATDDAPSFGGDSMGVVFEGEEVVE